MFATLPFDGLMAMDVGLAGPRTAEVAISPNTESRKHSLSPGIHTVLNPLAVAVAREPLDSARRRNVESG